MNRPLLSRQQFAFLTRKQAIDFLRSGGIFKPRRHILPPQFGQQSGGAQMEQGDRAYSFDANLQFSDNAAAYTASGYAQVGGADGICDFGGNQGTTPTQQARIDAVAVIDVTAIDIASTNETYKLAVLGCNTAGFASSVRELAAITLGKGAALVPATQADSIVGRYELMFSTELANLKHQFAKMYNTLAGTTPSISYQAFGAVLPEP